MRGVSPASTPAASSKAPRRQELAGVQSSKFELIINAQTASPGPGTDMREAQVLQAAIDRSRPDRDAELLVEPHDQIASPPSARRHRLPGSGRLPQGERGMLYVRLSASARVHHAPRWHGGRMAARGAGATAQSRYPRLGNLSPVSASVRIPPRDEMFRQRRTRICRWNEYRH